MNLTIAPIRGHRETPRLRHMSRGFAAVAFVVLLTTGAAQAGPVRINQVVQSLSSLQGAAELTLISQDPVTTGTKGSTAQTAPRPDNTRGANDPKLDSLLAGFTLTPPATQQIGVTLVEEGEVEGTICDCGEILIAGGFPKWPLAFLAAVPLAFIHIDNDCEDCQQSTPTPTPEPASLLLFGSGLVAFGAGLRRRYTKAKSRETKEDRENV